LIQIKLKPMLSKSHYLKLRKKPSRLNLVFILESPPVSGKYFYDPTGKTTEPLFAAMMKVIGENPATKKQGLTAFAEKGLFLIDATYKPVNHIKSKAKRNQAILSDLPELIKDLTLNLHDRGTPVILIKADICRLLKEPLKALGFNVINEDGIIPFPSNGWQPIFHQRLQDLFSKRKIRL